MKMRTWTTIDRPLSGRKKFGLGVILQLHFEGFGSHSTPLFIRFLHHHLAFYNNSVIHVVLKGLYSAIKINNVTRVCKSHTKIPRLRLIKFHPTRTKSAKRTVQAT